MSKTERQNMSSPLHMLVSQSADDAEVQFASSPAPDPSLLALFVS